MRTGFNPGAGSGIEGAEDGHSARRNLVLGLVGARMAMARGALRKWGAAENRRNVLVSRGSVGLPGVHVALLLSSVLWSGCGGSVSSPSGTSEAGSDIAAAPAETLTLHTIGQERYPLAICNDGSPPVFYYRRGTGDGARKWVLWFKGGGNCGDSEDCAERARTDPSLMSSRPWTSRPTVRKDGILSASPQENPDFYRWNHVFLVYCSSDSWSGTRLDLALQGFLTGGSEGIYFRGRYVTDAIVDSVSDPAVIGSPTLAEATHVVLTGSSAGATGLRNNIDRLAAQFRARGADVRAISDAALSPMVNPAMEVVSGLMRRSNYDLWQQSLDETCLAATGAEPELCGDGVYVVERGFIETPLFVHMDQADPLALENQQIGREDLAQRDAFAAGVRDLFARKVAAGFSPRAGFHVIVDTPRWNSGEVRIEGRTMADVVGNWYFGRSGPTKVVEP